MMPRWRGRRRVQPWRRSVAAWPRWSDIVAAHPGQQIVIGTHGNLLALILQRYDPSVGFTFWSKLAMPDAYRLRSRPDGIQYSRIGVRNFRAGAKDRR